jgi:hypothetical protein
MKPGADFSAVLNPASEDINKLSKNDVVILWSGTKDVGRNESGKGLSLIRNFVKLYSLTNVVVMTLPFRHDLEANSCVNKEIKIFNRKLRKYVKDFNYASNVLCSMIENTIPGMAFT